MERRRRNPVATALYVNAALLAAILIALLSRSDAPTLIAPAMGQAQQPAIAGGAGLFVVPAQFSTTTWGCYLMDVDQQTLCAYQYLPGEKKLRLVAARDFSNDRKLKQYNSDSPSSAEVKDLIAKEQAGLRAGNPSQPAGQPPAQSP